MSTSSIENLLQVTAAKPHASDSTRSNPTDRGLFREHLQRAADVNDSAAKPEQANSVNKVDTDESERTDIEDQGAADQHTNASETVETVDESEVQSAEVSQVEDETQDEVTLSVEVTVVDTEPGSTEYLQLELADNNASTNGTNSNLEAQVDGETVPGSLADTSFVVDTSGTQTDLNVTGSKGVLELQSQVVETESQHESHSLHSAEESSAVPETGANESQVVAVSLDAACGSHHANAHKQSPKEAEQLEQEVTLTSEPIATSEKRGSKLETLPTATTAAQAVEAEQPTPNNETSGATPSLSSEGAPVAAPTKVVEAVGTTQLLDQAENSSDTSQSTTPSERNTTPTVDKARFVQRVSGAFRAAQQRDGEIRLRLSPPELGSLRIEIVVKQGVLTAQLETETASARNLILDNLPALREKLAEQQISIEKFDVDVRDESNSQNNQTETQDRQSNTPSQRTTSKTNKDDSKQQSTEEAIDAPPQPAAHNGSLDVMI